MPLSEDPSNRWWTLQAGLDEFGREQLRQLSASGSLSCTSCGGRVKARLGEIRRPHFAHFVDDAACGWGPESGWHRAAKAAVGRAAKQAFQEMLTPTQQAMFDLQVAEEVLGEGHVTDAAIMLFDRESGRQLKRLSFEVQQSHASRDDIVSRSETRSSDGWDVLWGHFAPDLMEVPRWLVGAPAIGLRLGPVAGAPMLDGTLATGSFDPGAWWVVGLVSEGFRDDDGVRHRVIVTQVPLVDLMGVWLMGDPFDPTGLQDPLSLRGDYGLAWVPVPDGVDLQPTLGLGDGEGRRVVTDLATALRWGLRRRHDDLLEEVNREAMLRIWELEAELQQVATKNSQRRTPEDSEKVFGYKPIGQKFARIACKLCGRYTDVGGRIYWNPRGSGHICSTCWGLI